ncbi:O-antigen ligase family protein [Pectobacterium atrosepticum]|uniref:O-antigen ligase family protein n=1 Tax=Pectobacterium atrosepticum TaxID=29471 RepID=UPI00049A7F70|nr:O-antigen ligase family protein [Pectobacterium atrosepticum]GKV87471.1 O-antigen ligase [Pectobacterium carotovorum subsp. carotovorum]AIA69183.1 ligase [Pectobacterium atrosepticum]AIK12087.1 O-antigen ligase [Pectobacterium atrosepticum]ATY89034.1 ligase [Pectobacterium atrosepticum]MBL0893387.1 O-antigen ligase family protein [Pectobacterium atrosepticum]
MNLLTNEKTIKVFSSLIYTSLIISLIAMIFDVKLASKIFNTIGIISAILLFINKREIKKESMLIPLSILFLCVTNLIWEQLYKNSGSEIIGLYHSYHNVMKILFLGSSLTLFAMTFSSKHPLPKNVLNIIYTIPFFLILYYLLSEPEVRFSISDKIATSSAYMISFIGILTSQVILLKTEKRNLFFYFINHIIFFTIIVLSGTRAAILAYPLLSAIVLIPAILKDKKINLKLIILYIMVNIVCLVACQKTIMSRSENLISDINMYNQSNSESSVGARIAMYRSGLTSFIHAPMGQSAESRQLDIQKQAEQNPSLSGAALLTGIHLHNELIEAISLKGIIGGMALLLLYASLFYFSSFILKDYALTSLTLSLVIYGLSDVIFYGKNATTVWIVTYCLSILLVKRNRGVQ